MVNPGPGMAALLRQSIHGPWPAANGCVVNRGAVRTLHGAGGDDPGTFDPWRRDKGPKLAKPSSATAFCDRVTPNDRWRFPDLSGVVAGQGLGMKPQRPHVDHRRPALLPLGKKAGP